MATLPELKLTVYSDYICPFCYVGNHRLQRLRDSYDLMINWRFIEIHPETSADGEPIEDLDYPSETWQQMMDNLRRIADEENIPLTVPNFITNSLDALLLSEAVKPEGKSKFYRLHEALFESYFVEQKNIGDRNVLRQIAYDCGIDDAVIDDAWSNERYRQSLLQNYNTARQHGIQSVPSFIFGEQVLTGVVDEDVFRKAAELTISTSDKQPA